MIRTVRAASLTALLALGGACGDGTPPRDRGGPGDGAPDGAPDGGPDGALDAGLDGGPRGSDARDAADAPSDRAADVPVVGPPNACAPGTAWFDLPYTVASAAWSRTRGLIIVRPETEHAIYVLDPATCLVARVAVPRPPLSIAVSPTEADVAVGQDGVVSFIDVATRTVRSTIAIPAPATELAFDAAGHVVVFSHALASVATQLLLVDPAAAAPASAVTALGALDGGGHLRATADGAGIFWTNDGQTSADLAARVVVGRTPLLGNPVAAGPAACHGLFPTDDSSALITACGTVLALSPSDAARDLAPAGTLEGVTSVAHADTNAAMGLVAVIRPANDAVVPPPDGSLRIHAMKDLSFVGSIPLPVLDTGQERQTPHARYVFLSQDGARAYVLARRQPGQAPVDGIAVLAPASASASASDLAPTVKVTGSFPHRSGLPLPVTVPRVANTVSFRVTDAGYSRALDRLVMSSTKPTDAVMLVDPATGATEPLPAPVNPGAVLVRADGLVAAVTGDAGIRFFDLETRTVLRDVAGRATSVAFGAGSEVLLATGPSTSAWLDLVTGATRAASTTADETPGFSTVPGTNRFYSMRGRALFRHDDAIAPADPSFDLAPFVPAEAIVKPCATPFWITDDGSHLVLDCARVFSLAAERALDLRYVGFLENVSTLEHVAYAPTTHRFFSVPDVFVFSDGLATAIGRVAVHDDQSLDLVRSIDVGLFPGTAALSHPRRIFLGQTPQQIIVVAESDFFQAPTHAVYTLDVSGL